MLSIDNIITVSVAQSPTVLGVKNVNNLALFTDDTAPEGFDTYAAYTSATEVASDWGSSSTTYAMANAIFSQVPNILDGGGMLFIVAIETDETLAAAIARVADTIFFGGILSTAYPSGSDIATLATAVQAMEQKMLFFPSNDDSLIAGSYTTIKDASNSKTRCLLHKDSAATALLFAAAYASRLLSVDFSGSNTFSTMNLKSLAGIDADTAITQTIFGNAETAGVDLIVSYNGLTRVASFGANRYADEVYGINWFSTAIQTAGFNALQLVSSKIPQTEAGVSVVKGAYRQVCEQAVSNGFLAPGTWAGSDWIGNPADMARNIQERGYYIYSQPISKQSAADRAARRVPTIQIAAKMAGAFHKGNIIVNVE